MKRVPHRNTLPARLIPGNRPAGRNWPTRMLCVVLAAWATILVGFSNAVDGPGSVPGQRTANGERQSADEGTTNRDGTGGGTAPAPAGEVLDANDRHAGKDDVESSTEPPPDAPAEQAADGADSQPDSDEPPEPLPAPDALEADEAPDPASYGLWTLTPAIAAIFLAILARQVIPALVVGVLLGAYMMVPYLPGSDPYAGGSAVVAGFRLAAERYVFGALSDPENGHAHLKIVVFTLMIGFLVGVISRNGGTRGMVNLVVGESRSPRRGALTAWLSGMVVFFDDYANTMIVGPTMQPVFDRLKMSRAKLAYIVDSTAAPVSSIALIGTWVGTEVGLIDQGLRQFTSGTAPAFLLTDDGSVLRAMSVFLNSIPYRFYAILAIFLVFLVALTRRDFGPMKRSERKVLSRIDSDPLPAPHGSGRSDPAGSNGPRPRWWLGFAPVLILVAATVAVLVVTGRHSEELATYVERIGQDAWGQKPWWERAGLVVGYADSYLAIFYGAILASLSAVLLTMLARACPTRDAIDAGIEGMTRVYPAVVILVLAWSLSSVLGDLKLGEVVAERLAQQNFQARFLPLGVFLSAALISFATGTSWGTMGILCPMTVGIGAQLIGDMPPAEGLPLFYAAVGSVLAGAVFGDHCSPISDTTVLSSLACGCPHEEHVWTQIPYALVAAVAAVGLGDFMCNVYGQPWYLGLSLGAIFLVLWLYSVGRRPVPSFELASE